MRSRIRGFRLSFVAWSLTLLVAAAACSLNPQPVPPGATDSADAGFANGATSAAKDAAAPPSTEPGVGDGGRTTDADMLGDIDATQNPGPNGDGGDGGDGGDAGADGAIDAANDAPGTTAD